jgi:hypothetical protein
MKIRIALAVLLVILLTACTTPVPALAPIHIMLTATPTVAPTTAPITPTIVPTITPPPTPEPTPPPDPELDMLAQLIYGEARGCPPDEQALVLWTVFQRVDDGRFGADIEAIVTARRQFQGYDPAHPILPEILELCAAEREKWRAGEVPPMLAPYATATPYLFFRGDGLHNWFRAEW